MEKIKEKNYVPGSISFMEGFFGPKTNIGYSMIADYEKAKSIVEELLKEGRDIDNVKMGLDGDWSYNSNVIWENNKFFDYCYHDNSVWAEPIIIVYFNDGPSETYSTWYKKE